MARKLKFISIGLIGIICLCGYWLYVEKNNPTIEELVSEVKTNDVKIFLLGIDAATFKVIEPLVAAGELPHFKQLMHGGTYGPLRSEEPTKSPALWTTIVTGKNRNEHGVVDFLLPNPQPSEQKLVIPMSTHRKVPALWTIASRFKTTVGFTGWWASWPAEEVNGWVLSGAFTHANTLKAAPGLSENGHAVTTNVTYPELLADEFQDYIIDPMDPPVDEICSFAALTDEEIIQLKAVERPLGGYGLSVFKFGYCSQRGAEEATLNLLEKGQPDLAGIMLPLIDVTSHTFWHYYEPEAFPDYTNTAKIERFKDMIPRVYKHHDAFIGRLLKKLDPNTILIIVSDHGFQATKNNPKEIPAFELQENFSEPVSGTIEMGITGNHHIDGIILASGGPIKKGRQIKASIYDIFPTILALMGLPVPKDCEGRVLTDMIDETFFKKYPIKKIPSYNTLIPPNTAPQARGNQHKLGVDMLRGLGYIE